MGNAVVRGSKGSSLIPYSDPSLEQRYVEFIAWEECFRRDERYIRLLSQKDIDHHEASSGGYGVFTPDGELVVCKKTKLAADEWIELEGFVSVWMH
jgi:hypothetical protein